MSFLETHAVNNAQKRTEQMPQLHADADVFDYLESAFNEILTFDETARLLALATQLERHVGASPELSGFRAFIRYFDQELHGQLSDETELTEIYRNAEAFCAARETFVEIYKLATSGRITIDEALMTHAANAYRNVMFAARALAEQAVAQHYPGAQQKLALISAVKRTPWME